MSRGTASRSLAALILPALVLAAFALLLGACSRPSAGEPAALVVRRVATAEAIATPTPAPSTPPAAAAMPPAVAATPAPVAITPPTDGRWIDVDVTRFVVRLMEGAKVIREIAPVAVGAQIDTGEYNSTQTGLFHVYNKTAGLTYDAPYHTYIDWWVGFDIDKANGFHSFLLDERGVVVDASTGRVSNGCIRTGDPQAVFTFAETGMPVSVHF